MDESLLEAFAPVARDLRAAGLDCQLAESAAGDSKLGATAELIVSGVKVGQLTLGAAVLDVNSSTLYLAAQTQRLVQAAGLGTGGRPVEWPPCLPSHGHPMMATRGRRQPLWTCPLDGSISVAIGSHP